MSGEAPILVTFAAINEAAMDTDSIASQISQQLGDLKSYLTPLVGTWSGDASTEYQALRAKWDSSANDLNQVLRQMAQALRTAAENYQSTERKNSSIWS